jgi:chromosome segregation ATPase
MNTLRQQYKVSQSSHDNRRHELDIHLLEIEDLRKALTERESELERVEAEKARASVEKNDFLKMVKALEADLLRVRKDAERFGSDLRSLRGEKEKLEERRQAEKDRAEKAERAEKQLRARMRILNDELDLEKERYRGVREEWRAHVCAAYVIHLSDDFEQSSYSISDDDMLVDMKAQHKQECKGLIVQIKYLKAKFTRESCWRCDLGYQKKYLLVLLSRFERS